MQSLNERNDHLFRRWKRGAYRFGVRPFNILTDVMFHSFGRNRTQVSAIAIKSFKSLDPILVRTFRDETLNTVEKYDFLFNYLMTGLFLYRNKYPSLINYPGAPSVSGLRKDMMEGFTRMLPLICSWISSGRGKIIETLNGEKVDFEEIVKGGLIAGTDPQSPGYWGNISHRDLRICEAADIALSIWLVRDSIWMSLDSGKRRKIIHWLLSVNKKEVYDNNWHLFPVIVNEVSAALGFEQDAMVVQAHYLRFKSFYRGDGWFSDGPKNIYDYYNAWGIHYSLFWLNQINPKFDPDFISEALKNFIKNYIYFLTPQGFPILGRSICYRMAASAPIIAGHIQDPAMVDPGLARRALDTLWTFFISKGAVVQGKITQGYFKEDLRFLDNYSGPASCLWALRSLVLAFFCPKESPLWAAPASPLPIEISDYCVSIPSLGWTIKGIKESQEVIIDTGKTGREKRNIENYTVLRKIAGFIAGRPFRPGNRFVKYNLPRYSSKEPFCGCSQ